MTTGCSSPPPRFTSVTVMVIGPPSSCSALSWSLLGTIVSRRSLTLFDITDLHFVGDRPTGERPGLDAARVARPGVGGKAPAHRLHARDAPFVPARRGGGVDLVDRGQVRPLLPLRDAQVLVDRPPPCAAAFPGA